MELNLSKAQFPLHKQNSDNQVDLSQGERLLEK